MGSLDIDSLSTKISLEETTYICANTLFKYRENKGGLSQIEFKKLLSLATK